MNNLISIILQDDDSIVAFNEETHIAVYSKESGHWQIIKEVANKIDLPQNISLDKFRNQVRALIDQLDDCKIIAGKEISGLPYSIFDRMGFDIFSIDKLDDETLDGIISDIAAGDELERMRKEIIENAKPVETSVSGVYYLDLIALQEECPEISSKKALQSFLKETPFLELELICSHLPPWIEGLGFDVKVSKNQDNNKTKAIITNKFCEK